MILKNCLIITQNSEREIIHRGFLAIKNGRIVELGRGAPKKIPSREEVIDLKGKTIMPGLVNAHCHLGDSIYKGAVGSLKSPADLLKITNDMDAKMSEGEFKKRKHEARLNASAVFLKKGVTTLAGGSGLKEAVRYGVRFLGGAMLKGKEDVLTEISRIKEECEKSDLLFPGLFLHSLLEMPQEELHSFKKIARLNGFTLMMHLAEFPEEKGLIFEKYEKERIDLLEEIGLLSKKRKLVAVHGNFLEEKELERLSKYNVGLVLCPASSQNFGFKTIDLRLLEKYGIKKAVATDGPLTNPRLNLFRDVRLLHRKGRVNWQKLLDCLTIEAAEVLGIGEKVGSLESGKFADILVLRNGTTVKDIFNAGQGNIDFVIVGGNKICN